MIKANEIIRFQAYEANREQANHYSSKRKGDMPRTSIKDRVAKARASASGSARQSSFARARALAPARTGGFFGVGRRRILGERKAIDVDPTSSQLTTTATVTLLNGVATGTDFTDRIGRKIVMRSLYFRAFIRPTDNITGDTFARIIIVYDMQSNGAAPAATDVLKSANPAAQVNLNNRDRFKILFDKAIAVGKTDNTATQAITNGHNMMAMKKYKRLKHETLFNGTTAAIGSIATGSIYLLAFSDQAAGAGCELYWSSRIRFEDA